MTVSFVWFDLGYTLVYTKREEVYQKVLWEYGYKLPISEIKRAYHITDKLFMREFPGILGKEVSTYFPWYLGLLNYHLGVSLHIEEQMKRMRYEHQQEEPNWHAFENVVSFLSELRELSIRLGIISNWDHTARDVLQEMKLTPFFEHIIISSEVGLEKPDPAIFRLALQRAGVSVEECLYVGDNYYDDVVGSKKIGMKALLINPYGHLGMEEITDEPIIENVTHILPYISKLRVS